MSATIMELDNDGDVTDGDDDDDDDDVDDVCPAFPSGLHPLAITGLGIPAGLHSQWGESSSSSLSSSSSSSRSCLYCQLNPPNRALIH